MAINVSPSLQFQHGNLAQHNGSSSEFFRIATQFLANTPVSKTRETYGRELGVFYFLVRQ